MGFYLPANQICNPEGFGYNPAIVGYPYNVQKAKDLLTQAGYPNGFQTKIMYPVDPIYQDIFTAVQGYLSKVGITAELQPLDSATFLQTTTKGWSNAMVLVSVESGYNSDPGTIVKPRFSKSSPTMDPKSIYTPDDYNAKLDQALAELDDQKRAAIYQDAFKEVSDQCLLMPIWVTAGLSAMTSNVRDKYPELVKLGRVFGREWSPQYIWLSK